MSARHSSLAATLNAEIAWFDAVLQLRFEAYGGGTPDADPTLPAPPSLPGTDAYTDMCRDTRLDASARLVLILALLPALRPQALDPFQLQSQATARGFSEFGGLVDAPARGFRPTRQTALFLLAGDDLTRRLTAMAIFAEGAPLVRHHLLAAQDDDYAPWLPLDPHSDLLARLIGVAGGD